LQDEGIVFGQRQGISDQFIQLRLAESERRLNFPAQLLLAKNVGDVIGTEGARRVSFLQGAGNCFPSIVTNQGE